MQNERCSSKTELEKRKENFAHAWKNSLDHQINNLPDFELVYDKIIGVLRKYEENLQKAID